jgi:hypothetical protein
MKRLDRRTILAGIGVAGMALPATALASMGRTPQERLAHAVRELEQALHACYPGSKMRTLGETTPEGALAPVTPMFS